MSKEIVSVDKGEWETEVSIKVPSFLNFGTRMGAVELEFTQAIMNQGRPAENAAAPEEKDAAGISLPDYKGLLADYTGKLLDAAGSTLTPQLRAQVRESLDMLMSPDWRPEDDYQQAGYGTFDHDLQALWVVCPQNGDWDAASEARLDHFLDAWPSLRPQVLQAFCDYHEELHGKNQLFADPILAPEPGSPEIVEDRLRITSIHLREDGLIGLSGSCTWEDAHGVGVLLKGSDVIETGYADVATAPR